MKDAPAFVSRNKRWLESREARDLLEGIRLMVLATPKDETVDSSKAHDFFRKGAKPGDILRMTHFHSPFIGNTKDLNLMPEVVSFIRAGIEATKDFQKRFSLIPFPQAA